jgi:glyoxalase family protein
LTDHGLSVEGPLDRHYFKSIYFTDPDGAIIEIATQGPGWSIDEAPDKIGIEYRQPPEEMIVNNRDEERINAETWPEPVPEITADMALSQGMHHITAIGSDIQRTQAFFGDLLGMRRVKMTSNFDDPNTAHWYRGVGDGRPGTLIT